MSLAILDFSYVMTLVVKAGNCIYVKALLCCSFKALDELNATLKSQCSVVESQFVDLLTEIHFFSLSYELQGKPAAHDKRTEYVKDKAWR